MRTADTLAATQDVVKRLAVAGARVEPAGDAVGTPAPPAAGDDTVTRAGQVGAQDDEDDAGRHGYTPSSSRNVSSSRTSLMTTPWPPSMLTRIR